MKLLHLLLLLLSPILCLLLCLPCTTAGASGRNAAVTSGSRLSYWNSPSRLSTSATATATATARSSSSSSPHASWEETMLYGRGGSVTSSLPLLEGILQLTLNSGLAQGAQERRQYYRELPPQQVLGMLLLPQRLIKLGVLAIALAELLHKLGIVKSSPDEIQAKLEEYWTESGKPWTEKVLKRWKNSWEKANEPGGLLHADTWSNFHNIMNGLSKLPNQYQFALGGTLGLVASPLLWTVGVTAIKVASITYLVSEANYFFVTYQKDIDAAFQQANVKKPKVDSRNIIRLSPQLHGILERVRVTVRNLIKSPKAALWAVWEELDERLPQHYWEWPPYVSRGLVVGTVAGLILVL